MPIRGWACQLGMGIYSYICMYVLLQASPDLLNSFNMELGRHGNASPPIMLARELANVIHDE